MPGLWRHANDAKKGGLPKVVGRFWRLLIPLPVILAVYLFFALLLNGPLNSSKKEAPPASCEKGPGNDLQTKLDELYKIPTTAGSYIPGEMPYQSKSGKLQNAFLAPCTTAVGERTAWAKTNGEMSFFVNINPVCAKFQGIELKEETTTFFYVRLIGPTIVPGFSERVNRTTYRIFYEVYDPGVYSMQVAVEFAAAWGDSRDSLFFSQDAHLEGKEIQGSPFTVAVQGPFRVPPETLKVCEANEIGDRFGRWVLEKLADRKETRVNFLDAVYTWQPLSCRMPTWECMGLDAALKKCFPDHKFVPYMFGDSLMGIQLEALFQIFKDDWGKRIHTQMVDTSGGLAERGGVVNESIEDAAKYLRESNGASALWFNSGLHDLDKYCGQGRWSEWRVHKGFALEYDCLGEYVRYIKEVIAKVADVEFSGPKIFRTSPSSWMKFGNYHVKWDKYEGMQQDFLQSRYTIEAFNKDVIPLFKAAGWSIVDAYANTAARPDRSENVASKPGGGFVHFEQDIVDVHNRQLMGLSLMQLCPEAMRQECS